MKATLAKDLVIGKVYSDIQNLNIYSTLFRYDGCDEYGYDFTYLGGDESYGTGKIGFPEFFDSVVYELSEEELKEYLPTPPKG